MSGVECVSQLIGSRTMRREVACTAFHSASTSRAIFLSTWTSLGEANITLYAVAWKDIGFATVGAPSLLPLHPGGDFQAQRIEADEAGGVVLVVGFRGVGFHHRDIHLYPTCLPGQFANRPGRQVG